MAPLVSILIPAYNAERWISQTLESAINQDYPNKEIILVNDGSSDRTLEIAKRFESRFVKIIDQTNAGGPVARNKALDHSQGDYIQWLDHDDVLASDKISAQLGNTDVAQNARILFSCPFGNFYYRPDKAWFVSGPLWRDLSPLDYFLIKFSRNTYFQSSSWLVSRKLTEMAGPWWELRSPDDDGEYFCRVVAACERIHFVPEARCYWRVGNYRSFSEARSNGALEAIFESMCRCVEHFRSLEDSERTRAACVKFLQDRLIYFYPDSQDIVDRMNDLASKLGGTLSPPRLDWKYRLIKSALGWHAARQCQALFPKFKVFARTSWDKFMYDLSLKSAELRQ